MKEHEAQEHLCSDLAEGSGHAEERGDQLEDPPQRRGGEEASCLIRNEKVRLVVLGLALLALLVELLLDLLSGSVLPPFGTLVVVFLGYRRLDAWLDAPERPPH